MDCRRSYCELKRRIAPGVENFCRATFGLSAKRKEEYCAVIITIAYYYTYCCGKFDA